MATLPNYDYDMENAELQRRLKVAEALQQGGLAPMGQTEVVGGVAVKRSPLEALAKIAQAYAAHRQIKSVGDEQRNLGTRYRDELRQGVGGLIEGLSAAPGQSTAVADESGGHSGAPMSAMDANTARRNAILQAIGSAHPVLQQLGMSQLKSLTPETMTQKDWLGLADKFDPQSVIGAAQGGGVGALKPRKNVKEVGGVVYDADNMNILKLNGPAPEQVRIGDDLYEVNQSTGQLRKLDNAPKISVSNTMGSMTVQGQKAGLEAWSKEAAKTVSELAEGARAATGLMSRMNQLEALTQGGTVQGPMADASMFIAGVASAAGIPVDKNKLANSQTFASEATRAWAEMMQSMGGARGLVKEESEKIANSLPSLVQTPQGRAQIIALIRQAAQQQVADAKQASAEYSEALRAEDPAKFTFGLSRAQLPQSNPLTSAPGSVAPAGGKKRIRVDLNGNPIK